MPELGVDSDSSLVSLEGIKLQYSNLSALPSWMDDAFLERCTVYAGATPLCRWIQEATASNASAGTLDARYRRVNCDEDGIDSVMYYPLFLEEDMVPDDDDRGQEQPPAREDQGQETDPAAVAEQPVARHHAGQVLAPVECRPEGPTKRDVPTEPGRYATFRFGGAVGSATALLCVNVLHAICVCYFIIAGVLYRALPEKELSAFLDLYALALPSQNFRVIGDVHFVLATIQLACLLWHLFCSRRTRDRLQRKASKPPAGQRYAAGSLPASPWLRMVRHAIEPLEDVAGALFGSHGIFSVHSEHFEVLFLIRRIVETALQANQAYRMSRLVPRADLNMLYIAVLVINCWMSPLVHWFVKRKSLQRLLCVLSDVTLDFVTAIGVPVALTVRYLQEFDWERGNFPFSNWYNDVWVVNFMNESTIVLFGSWFDAFSRLIFSVSLLLCLEDARQLIKPPAASVVDPSKPKRDRRMSSRVESALRVASAISTSKHTQRVIRWDILKSCCVSLTILLSMSTH
ncbi:hypothetical protein ATCC90586_012018 [Pythium insidiosum]|nr:hypothetical protein ATCC90586_012018 [Pythium insidiosum]